MRSAIFAGLSYPGFHAIADQVPLELSQGPEDVKDELPAAGGRVDRLLEAAETALPLSACQSPGVSSSGPWWQAAW